MSEADLAGALNEAARDSAESFVSFETYAPRLYHQAEELKAAIERTEFTPELNYIATMVWHISSRQTMRLRLMWRNRRWVTSCRAPRVRLSTNRSCVTVTLRTDSTH